MSSRHRTDSALAALDAAPAWLNTEPLTAAALHGKVVLVDVWTYSCVNWLRTLPYIRAWADRYRDRGLVVAGVHAPEFGFEHDLDNVRRAVRELRVTYPVVIDNDFAIWRSLDNHYWPALYLVDRDGQIRFRRFGEGGYGEIEAAIQELLGVEEDASEVDAGGVAEAADWDALGSPETYLGRARGERRTTAGAADLALNQWALHGRWLVGEETAVAQEPGGAIAYRFLARDVNLVLAPPEAGGAVGFTVRLDGDAPGDDHGVDTDPSGAGTLDEPRMYQLVRLRTGAAERTFEISFDGAGARAYVFTFG
jgi:thiol-disulfide isomerase/thioredoxin